MKRRLSRKTICKLLPTANSIITTAAAKATTATRERTTTATTTTTLATNSYFQSFIIDFNKQFQWAGRQRGRQADSTKGRRRTMAAALATCWSTPQRSSCQLSSFLCPSVCSYHLVAPLNVWKICFICPLCCCCCSSSEVCLHMCVCVCAGQLNFRSISAWLVEQSNRRDERKRDAAVGYLALGWFSSIIRKFFVVCCCKLRWLMGHLVMLALR